MHEHFTIRYMFTESSPFSGKNVVSYVLASGNSHKHTSMTLIVYLRLERSLLHRQNFNQSEQGYHSPSKLSHYSPVVICYLVFKLIYNWKENDFQNFILSISCFCLSNLIQNF